jgi:WW domain
MSLWLYLSDLFEELEDCDENSRAALFDCPRYAHLLLRYCECGFIIRSFARGRTIQNNINQHILLGKLDELIRSPTLEPSMKSRAISMRLLEQCNWKDSGAVGLNGEPVSQKLIDESAEQIEEAVGLQKLGDIENAKEAGFAEYARALVHRALDFPGSKQKFESILEQLELCDRDDLYLSGVVTILRVVNAVSSSNATAFRGYLPPLQDILNLGEYGKLFYDGWWKQNYQLCIKTDLWKTICHEFLNGNLKPEGHREIGKSQPSVKDTTPVAPIQSASSPEPASRSVPPQTTPQIKQTADTSPAPSKPLPAGWERKVNENGQAYFINHNTKRSHWAKWHGESGECELRFAGNGRPYVMNHATQTQSWFDPNNPATNASIPKANDPSPRPHVSRVQSVPASYGHSPAGPAQRALGPHVVATQRPAHVRHSTSHGPSFAEQLTKMVVKEVVKDVVSAEFNNISGGGW